jgi:hypothetical protein
MRILLLLLLLVVSPFAAATCSIGGSPFFIKTCSNDTIDELIVDNSNPGVVVVSMALDDESNLSSSCSLYSPGIFGTSGLALRTTHPQFDKAYQTLLIAASSFLRVKIVLLTGPTGTCDIAEVSLTP